MTSVASLVVRRGRVVCTTLDSNILLHNAHTGKLLKTLEGHSGPVMCLAVSEAEGALFSGSDDETVRKWCLRSGELVETMKGHSDRVLCLAVSEAEGALFSGSWDATVRKWCLSSGELVETMKGHSDRVRCLAVSEAEGALFSGSDDKTVRKWCLSSGELVETMKGHSHSVRCLAVSEAEGALFSGSEDKAVRKWCLSSGELVETMKDHSYSVMCLAVSEAEGALFSGSWDATVRTWCLRSGELVKTVKTMKGNCGTHCLAVSEAEGALFSCSLDVTVRKWCLRSGELVETMKGHSGPVMCLAVSEAEGALFSGSWDATLRKWCLRGGELVETMKGHSGPVMCLAVSEAEGALFSGSDDKTVRKWCLRSGELVETMKGHSDRVLCLAVSEAEGALFSGSEDKTVRKWCLRSGELVETMKGHSDWVRCLAVSEAEGIGFSSSNIELLVWSVSSCAQLFALHLRASPIGALCLPGDGTLLSASTKVVVLRLAPLSYGVVVAAELRAEREARTKCLPWAELHLPWISFFTTTAVMIVSFMQMLGFAYLHSPTPPLLKSPVEVLGRVRTFGLPVEIHFWQVFTVATVAECILFVCVGIQGRLHDRAFMDPDDKIARYSCMILGLLVKNLAKTTYLPLLKVFAWPVFQSALPCRFFCLEMTAILSNVDIDSCEAFAPQASKVLSCLMGAALIFVVLRMARLDFEIRRLRMCLNPFDISRDRTTNIASREIARRHPLATKTPGHDQVVLVIRSSLLVGSVALGDKDSGVWIAVLRVCMGAALLLTGIKFDEFFPGRPGSLDCNAIQCGLHAALTATYFSSLCAALAVKCGGHHALAAPWISCLSFLVVPAFPLGFRLKAGRWPSVVLLCSKMKAVAVAVRQICGPQRSAKVRAPLAEPLLV